MQNANIKVIFLHLGGKYVFSELDKPCPGGFRMGCYHQQCCMEAMQLYKGKKGILKNGTEKERS